MITDDCIEWQGCRGTDGYGIGPKVNGKQPKAHRLAYCQHHGLNLSDIADLHVLHRCDNPPCINPNHLFLGTDKDNSDDKCSKGRQARGEGNGKAVLTEALVKEVRKIFIARHPEFGTRALARKYGISHQAISEAIRGKRWGHVS